MPSFHMYYKTAISILKCAHVVVPPKFEDFWIDNLLKSCGHFLGQYCKSWEVGAIETDGIEFPKVIRLCHISTW